jgi:hypothetical protein
MSELSILPGIDILRETWIYASDGTMKKSDIPWKYMIVHFGRKFDDISDWCLGYLNECALLFAYKDDGNDAICLCTDDENEKNKYIYYLTGFWGIPQADIASI